jgi:folate-binding Fe-S cluster repair protein YgfZ
MAFTPFPPRQPSSSSRLPLTLMTLDDWALATITGQDGEKYLQGQITADVSALTDDRHLLAAHCDAKGKMWSNLRFSAATVVLPGLNAAACAIPSSLN